MSTRHEGREHGVVIFDPAEHARAVVPAGNVEKLRVWVMLPGLPDSFPLGLWGPGLWSPWQTRDAGLLVKGGLLSWIPGLFVPQF